MIALPVLLMRGNATSSALSGELVQYRAAEDRREAGSVTFARYPILVLAPSHSPTASYITSEQMGSHEADAISRSRKPRRWARYSVEHDDNEGPSFAS